MTYYGAMPGWVAMYAFVSDVAGGFFPKQVTLNDDLDLSKS